MKTPSRRDWSFSSSKTKGQVSTENKKHQLLSSQLVMKMVWLLVLDTIWPKLPNNSIKSSWSQWCLSSCCLIQSIIFACLFVILTEHYVALYTEEYRPFTERNLSCSVSPIRALMLPQHLLKQPHIHSFVSCLNNFFICI